MEKTKKLADQAIYENVKDSTARKIIKYVMERELLTNDIINPSNKDLAKKYGWSEKTATVAISTAKKSQFIKTPGYGKKRCLELNVSFLKGKMEEILKRKPVQKTAIFFAEFEKKIDQQKEENIILNDNNGDF